MGIYAMDLNISTSTFAFLGVDVGLYDTYGYLTSVVTVHTCSVLFYLLVELLCHSSNRVSSLSAVVR